MLTITFGLGLTFFLMAKAFVIRRGHDMGTMSHQWVAVYAASQPAPAI